MSAAAPAYPSLASLVGHREAVRADDPLEAVQQRFATGQQDFMAVLDGPKLRGLCSRRDIGTLLGARYGFALYARAPVSAHLTESAVLVTETDPLTEVLQRIAARRDAHFYDDVLLVNAAGELLGLIYIRELVRLQTTLLLDNITELEARQAEIDAKNRQMEDDLRMAREVQIAMLPREFPACVAADGPALHFAQLFAPAGGVSGDFFDVLAVSPQAAGVIICDVMGHGVRSAFITAMIRSMLEELRPQAGAPGEFLTRLNAGLTRLLQRTGDLIFVTASYVVIDAAARRLRYAHAGHPAPLHWDARRGHAGAFPATGRIGGPALGLLGDHLYEEADLSLQEGDRVLLYTDGIFEVADAAGEEFGPGRLAAAFAATAALPLAEALTQLRDTAVRHAGGRPFDDDVCLVACELRADQRG